MLFTVTLNPAVDRELIVPEIKFDTVMRASSWRVDWGGKGFNVSRMLKSLGQDSTALGFAGGRSGEMLRDGLALLGIQTEFVWVHGETRTNISIVGDSPSHYVKVNEPGPTITNDQIQQILELIDGLAYAGDWWVLSGSLPPRVGADIYGQIIQILRRAGAKPILDAEGEVLRIGCQAQPFLVKPNHSEAETLTGLQTESVEEAVQTARTIRNMGPENVVISMGEKGAVLANQSGAWVIHTPKIQMRNPIGAGDSLVGGLVWGLNRGESVLESLKWGVACGAATASLSGTALGTQEMVGRLLKEIDVTTWSD